MKYFYVVTCFEGVFSWRVTLTKGQFSLGSIIEEGVFLLNWKEITRDQAVDLMDQDAILKLEEELGYASPL